MNAILDAMRTAAPALAPTWGGGELGPSVWGQYSDQAALEDLQGTPDRSTPASPRTPWSLPFMDRLREFARQRDEWMKSPTNQRVNNAFNDVLRKNPPPQFAPWMPTFTPGNFPALPGSAPTTDVSAQAQPPAPPQPPQPPVPTPQPRPFDPNTISGYNPAVGNMADPTQLGVPAGNLSARQVFDPASGQMVNDFYSKSLFGS